MSALDSIEAKILSFSSLGEMVNRWKSAGRKIIFTNGCFDLIHYGHLAYLAEAKSLGDILILGLNSQASVQRLKGENRPVKEEKTRAFLLASLTYVDAVCIFEADTPIELIKSVKPDILVKGGDYKKDQIVGAPFVESYGGQVRTITFQTGFSSTRYIDKIKA